MDTFISENKVCVDTRETKLLMKFITYSGLNRETIARNLGQNDYSDFFVLQDCLPLLQHRVSSGSE